MPPFTFSPTFEQYPTILPIYILMRDLQLLDNLIGLVILYTAMNLPIAIWMLRSFSKRSRAT